MIELDDWQKEVLDHEGDLLLCTGRRVGKTYIYSRKAIEHMIKYRKQIIVVSLTEDQAMLIVAFALQYAREKCPKLIGKGRNRPTYKNLTLIIDKKPVKLISRPVGNTGDSSRGFEGGVLIVDEASRMPHMFWIAAKPILLTQAGEIWMCSTPHGKQGYFWDKFNEAYNLKKKDARFKVVYVNTEDVMHNRPISPSWTEAQRLGAIKMLAEDKKDMSALEYGQEYMGLFLEELRQYFSDDLIRKRMIAQRRGAILRGRNYYLGVDVGGQGGAESTFEVLEEIDNRLIQRENQTLVNVLTTDTSRRALNLENDYHFRKLYIDDGGAGFGVFSELIEDERTRRKTIAINNAARTIDKKTKQKKRILKNDLYENMLVLMELGKIDLLDDPEIFVSLKSVQYEYAEGQTKIFGNYTHIAEGLIRAAWCAKDKSLNIWVR